MKPSFKKWVLACSLFSVYFFNAQNLVPNPSFDVANTCPTITAQWNYCANWYNCNGIIGSGLWGTPDYYHTCGTVNSNPVYNPVPPSCAMGFLNPNTGGGMMGLSNYNNNYPNYREYISADLNCSLFAGNVYTVSFWVNIGTNPKYKYTINNLGVYLSPSQPVQTTYSPIAVIPQFEITSVINNTVWTQYSFTINPTVTLDFITIGNFRTDAETSIVNSFPSSLNWPWSYWFIDDISVTGPGSVSSITSNISCFGGSNGSATVIPTNTSIATYTWAPTGGNSSVATNLSAGIYTVNFSNGCGVGSKTVSINQPNILAPNLTPSLLLCREQSIQLVSSTTGGTAPYTYTWSNGPSTSSINVSPSATTSYTVYITDANGCNTMAVTTVSVDNCIGLPENNSEKFTNIYPNPATDFINIISADVPNKIQVINCLGQTVLISESNCSKISVVGFEPGIYYVLLSKDSVVFHTQKIIVAAGR